MNNPTNPIVLSKDDLISEEEMAEYVPDLSNCTPEELREIHYSSRDPNASIVALGRILQQEIIASTVTIPFRTFANLYVDGLMSDDPDRNEYTRKKLAEHAGSIQHGFIITDDEHMPLFYVPSIIPRLSTGLSDHDASSVNANYLQYKNSQYYGLNKVHDQMMDQLSHQAYDRFKVDESKRRWYMGWYEIFDFYGRLFGEEEELYRPHREKYKKGQPYIFWVYGQPMHEYIEHHGRATLGFENPDLGNNQGTHVLPPSEQDTPEVKAYAFQDTDDWE